MIGTLSGDVGTLSCQIGTLLPVFGTIAPMPEGVRGRQKQFDTMEGNGVSYADVAAMVGKDGNGNGWMNNPFMYLIWLAYLGGGGFGFGGNRAQGVQDAEIMGQLGAIRDTMAANQNANAIGGAIQSNHDLLHGITGAMNMGFAGTAASINGASTANLLSQKDAAMQMATCCCDIKSNILNQTNQLQSQIAQLANGVQTGFANLGFLTQQQTTELNAAATANTQRILDKMCADTTQDLRDKLAAASQTAQTNYLISQLKTT